MHQGAMRQEYRFQKKWIHLPASWERECGSISRGLSRFARKPRLISWEDHSVRGRTTTAFSSALRSSSRIALALFAPASLSSCSTFGYLYQTGRGQPGIINNARPISKVLQDERTPPRVKSLLETIPSIKSFGETYGLKATRNYVDYVKLDRDSASYVVSACDPLAFKPKKWSFPIVGSFTYLGWFDLGMAKSYAASLKKQGLDVDLRGAAA